MADPFIRTTTVRFTFLRTEMMDRIHLEESRGVAVRQIIESDLGGWSAIVVFELPPLSSSTVLTDTISAEMT